MELRVSPKSFPGRQALGIIAAALITFSSAACAAHQSEDYRFEVVDQPVPVSAHSEFDVKLTKTSTGQLVENATVSGGRLEMTMEHPPHKSATPGTMSTKMGGEVKVLGSPAPGLYRMMGDVSMPGTWKLDLSANIPGEPKEIEGTTKFKAGK